MTASGSNQPGPGAARAVVTALFFVSGLSSLVLETVWVRMMVLVFGSTSFAVSTVLTAFMGGLALGSFLAGRRAARLRDPRKAVLVYGLLEGGIGLYALLLPALVAELPRLHAALWGVGQGSYLVFALSRFAIATLLLLLPTAAMGATLPVLARFACAGEPPSRTSTWVGRLYAINTFGAVAGVALAGFLLLPLLGQRATNRVACLADLALGALAVLIWALSRDRDRAPATQVETPGAPPPRDRLATIALWSIAASGAVAMVYQVAWTRALSLVIGSSTYAFSAILVCFLVGLSSGAALYSARHARQPDQAGNLGMVHLLTAGGALGGALIMDRLPTVMLLLLQRVELRPGSILLLQLLLAGLVLLLPTFFMGMVFPAVIALRAGGGREPSRTTGEVYAVNTVGAIVGSFAGGFLLLPWLGLQRTLLTMLVCSLGLALLFGVAAAQRATRFGVLVGTLVLGGLTLLGWRPWHLEVLTSGVFRISRYESLLKAERRPSATPGRAGSSATRAALDAWEQAARRRLPPTLLETDLEQAKGYRILSHRDGVTTAVSIARSVDDSLSARACWVRHGLVVNGKVDASLAVLRELPGGGDCGALLRATALPRAIGISAAGDAETQILSGLLPSLLLPRGRRPRSVAVIGWGSGMSVGAALQAEPRRVVAVELEAEVIRAARVFSPHNHDAEHDPRVRLVAEDGRNYLAATRERFDVVISEPSNPWISGCGNLFTSEFFAHVRDRLDEGGLFLQWVQAYEIAPENVWSLLGTLADVFPSVHVFSPDRSGADLLLVAGADRRPLDWSALEARLAEPKIREELGRIGIRRAADLLARRLAGPEGVRRLASGAPRNTDDNARIEFAAPLDLVNYRRFSSRRIVDDLGGTLRDPLSELTGGPPRAEEELCEAMLRAGRTELAARLASRHPGLWRCAATAHRLGQAPPELDRATLEARLARDPRRAAILDAVSRPAVVAAGKLATLLRPESDQRLGFPLLGQLLALAEDEHRAAFLLLAARADGEGSPAVRDALARLLYGRRQFAAALQLLR